jgi:hypothetical protein
MQTGAVHDISQALLQNTRQVSGGGEIAYCCTMIAGVLGAFEKANIPVRLSVTDGVRMAIVPEHIDPIWRAAAAALMRLQPDMMDRPTTPTKDGFTIEMPPVEGTPITIRVSGTEGHHRLQATVHYRCTTCRTEYATSINAQACAKACQLHPDREDATAMAARRALMVQYWDGLTTSEKQYVAIDALRDMETVEGNLLSLHQTILGAVGGAVDGEVLMEALERVTEGTCLIRGAGTGTIAFPERDTAEEWEALLGWWLASRLAAEAHANALLVAEETAAARRLVQKNKKKAKKKKKKCVPWSVMYTWPAPTPGEFDPAAAILFLERRMREVLV